MTRPRLRFGGLRGRLLVTFVLVSLISAATATALAYRQNRDDILKRAQNSALQDFRHRISMAAEEFVVPPDPTSLTRFANNLAAGVRDVKIIARYRDLVAASDDRADQTRITPQLRAAVRATNHLRFQRVEWAGQPWLVAGTPVTFGTSEDPSGVEVFEIVPLSDEERDTTSLLTTVGDGTLPVAALAAVLALLAAGTVLRPVRHLGQATRQLATGQLDTRVAVKGRDELAHLASDFNDTADALQTSVTQLRDQEALARRFVADVSHELRTPLAAMTMVSAVLDEDADQLPPDVAHAARTVSTETAKLARLVDDLIEISRFDGKAATLTTHELDVTEALRATLAARGWTHQVQTRLPDGVRARLDRRRLDVIIANLVSNALRHGAPPVTLTMDATATELAIEVSDHGPGLAPESAHHVFDRFYKADSARTRSEGSGLGMAIAQENAQLHGGAITVANRPKGGAVFTLRLPRHPQEAPR